MFYFASNENLVQAPPAQELAPDLGNKQTADSDAAFLQHSLSVIVQLPTLII